MEEFKIIQTIRLNPSETPAAETSTDDETEDDKKKEIKRRG